MDNGRKKGKDDQGTCINDTWTKPKGDRIKGGRWEWVWQAGRSGEGEMETTVLEKQFRKKELCTLK